MQDENKLIFIKYDTEKMSIFKVFYFLFHSILSPNIYLKRKICVGLSISPFRIKYDINRFNFYKSNIQKFFDYGCTYKSGSVNKRKIENISVT